ncbi:hypothetical protein GLYMA_03G050400v4 [Glycine max]|nr:hypothetical protein GLYMA_03G050400v4 [Glycine max]
MASINFNPFGGNWFSKPPNPLSVPSLPNNLTDAPSSLPPNFAAISLPNPFRRRPKPKPKPEEPVEPGHYEQLARQVLWECENLPDHRHTPEVDKILADNDAAFGGNNDDSVFVLREDATEEEVRENAELVERLRSSPVVQFMARAEEILDKMNEMELKENERPYHKEDWEVWKNVPNVIGLDGRPMPRKAQKTREEADDKFWDFARQFFFGLWNFRQRPYPPGKPIDAAQSIGYKNLDRRYYDFIMRSGGWYYKDRLGRTRGPLELITLKTAWGAGIIDKNTFIWGEDMDEWAPIHMIYGMERAIATWEVRLAASATALLHKLQKGIPPWVPLKGFEKKTYKQLQEEAIESKRRDLAVLEANDGLWPGAKIPSHALFLWASGSELTTILEQDHMPNKYIPKYLRDCIRYSMILTMSCTNIWRIQLLVLIKLWRRSGMILLQELINCWRRKTKRKEKLARKLGCLSINGLKNHMFLSVISADHMDLFHYRARLLDGEKCSEGEIGCSNFCLSWSWLERLYC